MDKRIDMLRDEQQEYCPPLDSSLFFAILSDYDNLDGDDAIRSLLDTLETLRTDALLEEETRMDLPRDDEDHIAAKESTSGARDGASLQGAELSPHLRADLESETENTTVSDAMSHLNIPDSASSVDSSKGDAASPDWSVLEKLGAEDRLAYLMEMFPTVQDITIVHCLREAGDDVKRAVEELLNYAFIEQEAADGEGSILPKGVEGFAAPDDAMRGRKRGKGRKKNREFNSSKERSLSPRPAHSPADENIAPPSKWAMIERDINFITSRTTLSPKMVSSVYHANGASISSALRAILDAESKKFGDIVMDGVVLTMHASQLGEDFPSLPDHYLKTLIRLTHPSTASAHELAKELTSNPPPKGPSGIEIITRLPPVDLSNATPRTPAKKAQQVQWSAQAAAERSRSYTLARNGAFSQAAAAHRRSKSNYLMAGAASYYGSLGREYDSKAKRWSAAAADALVEANSTDYKLDLHGVSVKDAVRIAREKVTAWWVGLGDARIGGGRSASMKPYRIVTGIGKHSEDGKAKIGPAVARMLVAEGWKVQIEGGALTVLGGRTGR